jgi:hypothetical protein
MCDAVVTEFATHGQMNGDALHTLTIKVIAEQDVFTTAMAAACGDERARRTMGDETECEALIDSVLHGRLFEQSSVWNSSD